MTGRRASLSASDLAERPSLSDSSVVSRDQSKSIASFASSTGSIVSMSSHASPTGTSPRVQLVPHVHRLSYDSALSQSERDVLDSTFFDALDMSSKDFDFDDIFTYDRPQKRLSSVKEVSSSHPSPPSSKDKSGTHFSFSNFTSTTTTRQKVNKRGSGIGEMYVKNKSDSRRKS